MGPEAKTWEHSRNGDLGKMCALSKPGIFDLVAPYGDSHKFLEVFQHFPEALTYFFYRELVFLCREGRSNI